MSTKEQQHLKRSERGISQVLKLNRGGARAGLKITPKIIAKQIVTILVNGVQDGSMYAFLIISACKVTQTMINFLYSWVGALTL